MQARIWVFKLMIHPAGFASDGNGKEPAASDVDEALTSVRLYRVRPQTRRCSPRCASEVVSLRGAWMGLAANPIQPKRFSSQPQKGEELQPDGALALPKHEETSKPGQISMRNEDLE